MSTYKQVQVLSLSLFLSLACGSYTLPTDLDPSRLINSSIPTSCLLIAFLKPILFYAHFFYLTSWHLACRNEAWSSQLFSVLKSMIPLTLSLSKRFSLTSLAYFSSFSLVLSCLLPTQSASKDGWSWSFSFHTSSADEKRIFSWNMFYSNYQSNTMTRQTLTWKTFNLGS